MFRLLVAFFLFSKFGIDHVNVSILGQEAWETLSDICKNIYLRCMSVTHVFVRRDIGGIELENLVQFAIMTVSRIESSSRRCCAYHAIV